MLLRNVLTCILLLVCSPVFGATPADSTPSPRYVNVLLAAQSAYSAKQSRARAHAVVSALYDLKRSGKDLNRQYTSLLDYYLGTEAGEVLAEFITKQHRSILADLHTKLTEPVACMEKFATICISSKENRDVLIKELIKAVERGVILCADETHCDE